MKAMVIRMLEVSHLTKVYDKTVASSDVSFAARGGEITILAGPNGAGKSTVIKSIVGLLRFTGAIRIGGYDNKSLQAKALLGYVPEIPNLYDYLTVREHLEFIARAYSLQGDYQAEIDRLLERFELTEVQKKTGSELSKGMMQKVSVCCALLHRPKLILFDEPLVGLDPHAIKELKAVFRGLRQDGVAVLISTHMLDSVEGFWDTVHIMKQGQICATRTRAAIEDSGESLEDLFFQITEGAAQ